LAISSRLYCSLFFGWETGLWPAILNEVQARLDREIGSRRRARHSKQLEEKGLLTSSLGPGTEVRAGRPRRYYKFSSSGQRALNDARSAVNNLWRGFRWPLKGHS
jgi:hypothetical protein